MSDIRMTSLSIAVGDTYAVSIPARCDCGHRWTFQTSNDPALRDPFGCPVCGAGFELRAYGPLPKDAT